MDKDNDNNNDDGSNKRSSWRRIIQIDMEKLEQTRWWRACVAGSMAGLMEHTLLYPIDTVKTRMQAVLLSEFELKYKSFLDCFAQIIRNERPMVLFRGWPAVVVAAVPSHGMYFGMYEYSKFRLGAEEGLHPLKIALAGAFAAMAHDAIVTPFDVIKQRMQLKNCPYSNICSCAFETLKYEGYVSFFRSYPTTVLLNIPTFSTNFVVYEASKIALKDTVFASEENWLHHLIAGGIAGGVAGLVSNPLDVIKTSIQTDYTHGYKSILGTVKKIMYEHPTRPYSVFFSGATARATYMIPSAAITWTVYEAIKDYLGFPIHDIPMI
eukprot:CAMPEP_0197051704 /NCGR_PEP_ID=MMETSP1384-20130603/26298_1 /TAXON_ID=29189 /ORGANISM="Ammonia sp." /LENGTH=322 /DNA_ID=CAMNT_0042484303 /DNA_START=228 /DNA_END=1196 /DNA_ORIENTATION=-